jgi:hypothetical protein
MVPAQRASLFEMEHGIPGDSVGLVTSDPTDCQACCSGSVERDRSWHARDSALSDRETLPGSCRLPGKSEVCGYDIVALWNAAQPLAIVEMKLGFNLELLQAVDRMRAADETWLAVPATPRGRDRDPRVHRLCRLIGVGQMAVDHVRDRVEILTEPALPAASRSAPVHPIARRTCAAPRSIGGSMLRPWHRQLNHL